MNITNILASVIPVRNEGKISSFSEICQKDLRKDEGSSPPANEEKRHPFCVTPSPLSPLASNHDKHKDIFKPILHGVQATSEADTRQAVVDTAKKLLKSVETLDDKNTSENFELLKQCLDALKKPKIDVERALYLGTHSRNNLFSVAIISIINRPDSWIPDRLGKIPAKEVIGILIANGINRNYVDLEGKTALHLVFNKSLPTRENIPKNLAAYIIFKLLNNNRESAKIVNAQDIIHKMTPAHLAAKAGNYPALINLIGAGGNHEIRDSQNKNVNDYISEYYLTNNE